MKITAFSYTDSKGARTERQIMVTQEPTDKVSGIDLTELSYEDVEFFTRDYNELYGEFLENVAQLQIEYELRNKYRQFIPARMENAVTQYV
jgi:hypothetical protein